MSTGKIRHGQSVGDNPDAETPGNEFRHRQRHAVYGNAAFRDDQGKEFGRGGDIESPIGTVLAEEGDGADRIDMARHEVATEAIGGKETGLEIKQVTDLQLTEVGQSERLREQVKRSPIPGVLGHREAAAVMGDAIAGPNSGEQGRLHG